ncbi:hypothetical protein [Methylocaldum sp.]|uniref:hypothetical protein n=1 Tax=Methylocaldum sp. TaxID=1969727 RepID=UPI002D242112|nr:hypothetical protein [Methylocaldum sp.]HYE34110.1 hypothetical protein [Methylocaldum sp.]
MTTIFFDISSVECWLGVITTRRAVDHQMVRNGIDRSEGGLYETLDKTRPAMLGPKRRLTANAFFHIAGTGSLISFNGEERRIEHV